MLGTLLARIAHRTMSIRTRPRRRAGHLGTRSPVAIGLVAATTTNAAALAQPQLPGSADQPTGDELVEFEVAIEHSPFNPEDGTTLALVYDVQDDWHIYWRNNGDTGMPPQWSFDLPAGVSLGEPKWPAPERYTSGGGFIMDYILEGKVVILFPLTIDENFIPSMIDAGTGELTIRVDTEWLVCKDVCLPGSAQDEVVATFAATSSVPHRDALFAAARERLPIEPDDAANGAVEAEFADGALSIEAPRAVRLTFFPAESDAGVSPLDEKETCHVEGSRMTIRYNQEARDAERIRGVLRVEYPQKTLGKGERLAVEIDVPGPAWLGDDDDQSNQGNDANDERRDGNGAR